MSNLPLDPIAPLGENAPAMAEIDNTPRRNRIRELEQQIADLEARWPAHSVPPSMVQQLEELEDELDRERRAESP